MKKIYFAIAACAIFAFAACNNSTETAGDDTMKDTSMTEPTPEPAPTMDSNTTTMDSGATATPEAAK